MWLKFRNGCWQLEHICVPGSHFFLSLILGRGTRVGDREEGQSKADCGVDIFESSNSLGSNSDKWSTSEGEETEQSSWLVVTTGTSMLEPFQASGAHGGPRELFFLLRKFARRIWLWLPLRVMTSCHYFPSCSWRKRLVQYSKITSHPDHWIGMPWQNPGIFCLMIGIHYHLVRESFF